MRPPLLHRFCLEEVGVSSLLYQSSIFNRSWWYACMLPPAHFQEQLTLYGEAGSKPRLPEQLRTYYFACLPRAVHQRNIVLDIKSRYLFRQGSPCLPREFPLSECPVEVVTRWGVICWAILYSAYGNDLTLDISGRVHFRGGIMFLQASTR